MRAAEVLHGEETDAWGDAGYLGIDAQEEMEDSGATGMSRCGRVLAESLIRGAMTQK